MAVSRAIKRGWLTRLFRGVYLVGRRAPTDAELERAGLLASGPDAVLGFRSGGQRHNIVRWSGPVETITPRARRAQPGLHPRHRVVTPQEITTVDGVPVTTVAATLWDLATVLSPVALGHAVHEAEYRKKLVVADVLQLLDDKPGRPGAAELRRLVVARRPIVGTLNRGLERRFHVFLAARSYPPSEHNVPFVVGGERLSVDVLFREAWLAVEVDGGVHATTRNHESDRRRDRRLYAELDLPVIRITAADLDRPDELDADLRAALARRMGRS